MARRAGKPAPGTHAWFDQMGAVGGRLNWLRAAVLGANDGIVSVAGLVIGVAGASASRAALVTAGIAGLSAGAMSMAVGEYVSVSAQRDTERGILDLERRELAELPEEELAELTGLLRKRGLSEATARVAAVELTDHDAFAAHADLELGLDPTERTNPWEAAGASALAFVVGALVPFLAILIAPREVAVPVTVAAVALALAATGVTSARLGRASVPRAVLRNVLGGLLAMGVTYWIGRFFGAQI
ncbi:MAG: VIT family protein [Austwickia sp.]|nr:VIT family protein [Austwickia sp.]MCO5308556.1 VIT family protein [Austwickia sp.]